MPGQDALTSWLLGVLPPYTLPILIGLKEFWDECDDGTRLVMGFFGLVLFISAATRSDPGVKGQSRGAGKDDEEADKRPTNTPLWRRLWWHIHKPLDVMQIGGLQLDRTRKPHCAWLGPTGAGKSQSVATTRVDGARPTLIVTPDVSDPMRDATRALGGVIWTACESAPVNFLLGQPTEVAERLTEVFRSGGVGAWKRSARLATADVIRGMDEAGEPRSLHAIGLGLQLAVRQDRDLRTVCAGWVGRFLDLADQFGSSIGEGGFDLVDLLRSGRTVLLEVDAFDHPSLGMDVVALGLAEARRCAQHVPNGFRLIFEEAGQLGDRIDLAEPFFRAGRRRRIATDVLTHVESDLPDPLNANVATHIYFRQQLKSSQRTAADRLGLDYHELAAIPDFHAFVNHDKIRRLVKFPKPSAPRHPLPPPNTYETHPTPSPRHTPYVRRMEYTELPVRPGGVAELPFPRLEVQEVLAKIDRTHGDCWLWTGKPDKDGYAVQRWAYEDPSKPRNNRPAHQVVWEIVNGRWFPRNDSGKAWDWDHGRRDCPRHCVSPYHGEPVPNAKGENENSRRRWRVRGVGTPA